MRKKIHISDESVRLTDLLDQLGITDDISLMVEEMREDIYLELNQRIQSSIHRVFYLKIVAVAAFFILLVGFSSYISYHEGYKKQHSQTVTAVNPLGLQSSLVLPDGTAVLLNAGTTLSYPSAFIAKSREVIIEGEAFFEVAHDAAHPFIVKAENVRVQVLGTKFNVKAYKEEGNIEVTLEEGSVGVRLAHQSDLIRITPGEQICFSKVAQKFVRREVNPELYMAWRERAFHFNNVTFDNIARQLERRFNVHVEIATEDLKKIRFTGDFVRDENLLQILQVITTDKRMLYEIDKEDNNKIRIYNRNTD